MRGRAKDRDGGSRRAREGEGGRGTEEALELVL